jgi:hypothetical protein
MSISYATQREWFITHVQTLVASITGEFVEPDIDGDLALSGETARAWVRPDSHEPWGVQVFAVAAQGVPLRAAVLKELNEVNARDPFVRVAWHSPGSVMVSYRLFADAVSEENLALAVAQVVAVADQIGPLLAAVHGGSTPLAVEPSASDA